ncbi:MAG TPA: hypothetical protein VGO58_17675 [Chitinophagaceae bacterium]|jgi:hypothetical protein|nr:hypothetical protein [Chitinophagaceae bacterium]
MKAPYLFGPDDRPTLHDRRDMNKMSLDSFTYDLENRLEDEADDTIRRFENENIISKKNAEELERIRKTDLKRWEELQDRARESDINLDHQIHEHYYDIFLHGGVQYAFAEVKVIYAFKQLEIGVNQMLKGSYPNEVKKNLNRFEDLHTFCQSKGIAVNKIDGYTEINQLQRLSNTLKHSGAAGDRLKGIPEFEDKEEILFDDIEAFYSRIKEFPRIFLRNLGTKFFEDLYEFSDQRMESLAESFVLRMDKETAIKFMHRLGQHYA